MNVNMLIEKKINSVLPGTIYFETKSTENYLHHVMEVRAKKKVKVDNTDGKNQGVNGEVMAVDMIRVHEVVIKHHHRQELRDRWQRLHRMKVLLR